MNIQQIRQKYPQYDDISDRELAELLRRKFYADLEPADFNRRIGLAATPPAPEGSWLGDVVRSFGQGATGALGATAAVAGADNPVAQYFSEKTEAIGQGLSAERQAELQQQAERMKRAEESGSTWEEIKAGALNVLEAPVQSAAQAVGSFAPLVLAVPLAKLGLGTMGVTAALGALGAAQGAGAVKQSIYEAVERAEIQDGKSPEEAAALAERAQNYVSENIDQIALGGGLGLAAGVTGVERLLPGVARTQAGVMQQALAKRIGERGARAVGAGLAEAPLEGTQGGQERLAANLALQRTGRDVDALTGVAGAVTQEALMGGLGGVTVGAAMPGERPPSETPEREPDADIPPGDLERTVRERLAEEERLSSDEYLLDLDARFRTYNDTLEALRSNIPAEGSPGFEEANARFEQYRAENQQMLAEYNDNIEAIDAALRERARREPDEDTPVEDDGTDDGPAFPELADIAVPEPTLRTKRGVSREPEVVTRPEELAAPEPELPKTTQNWMKTTAGQEFVRTLQGLDPMQLAEVQRTLRPNTHKRRIFDAYFGTLETAAEPDGVRSEPATAGPRAEPSVGVPSGDVGQPGAPAADAQPSGAPDTSGVDAGRATPTEPSGSAQPQPSPLTAPETPSGPETPQTVEAEAQRQEAVGAAPAAPTAEVTTDRTTGEINTDLELLLNSYRTLTAERDSLLDMNNQPPAPGSNLRQRWDAVNLRIQDAEVQGQALVDELNAAKARDAAPKPEATLEAEVEAPKEKLKDYADDSMTKAGKQRAIDDLNSALDVYNAPAQSDSALDRERQHRRAVMAARYIRETAEQGTGAEKAYAQKLLDEEILPKDIELSKTSYRVTGGAAAPGAGMEQADVQRIWDRIVKEGGWDNVPDVKIVQSESQLPIRIFRQMMRDDVLGTVPGLFDRGTVYLIADNIVSPHDAALTIAHEVTGHYGLQGILGPDYANYMMSIYRGNAKIRAATDALMRTRPALDTATATEEVLVQMQEQPVNHPTIRRLYNRLKDFLAKITGLKRDAYTDAQVEQLLWQARTWVRRGQKPTTEWAKKTMYRTPTSKDFAAMVRESEIMRPEPNFVKRAGALIGQATNTSSGINMVDRFRVAVVDNMAAVDLRLNALFDGAVRTASGLINPMGLMRQAQDSMQLLLPFITMGRLEFDKTTGSYKAVKSDLKPMAQVLKDVEAWGKKKGLSYNEASAQISKMLEALRLDALDKRNKANPDEPQIPIHRLVQADKRKPREQIDLALAEYNADATVQQIKADLDAVKNHLVEEMARVGRISTDEAAAWKEALEYVPFDRVQDLDSREKFVVKRKTGKGLAQLGNLPELVGTQLREVGNVFDNSIRLQGWMISQVVRQDAVSQTLKMLAAMGSAKKKGRTADSVADASKRVKTYERGQPVFYEMENRYLVPAFTEMTVPRGPIVQFAQGAANILRKTITAMPPFAVTQLTKDIYRAFAQSGVKNPYALVYPAIKNFLQIGWAELMGKKHPLLESVNMRGIGGGYDIDYADPSDGVLEDLGLRSRGAFKTAIHKLDAITRASDVAVRIAIHNRTLAETGDQLLATTRAREFINFRRRGASQVMPALVATIPFMNAYLQGMDVLYRQATGKGASSGISKLAAQRAFVSRMAQLGGLTILYSLAVSGTEDYEELDALTRANNFIIPGTSIKIPVAGELGAIFKVPVEAALEYFRKTGTPEEKEAAELSISVFKYAFDQYAMGAHPAIVKPVIEGITNYSFFTGRALEGTYQQELDPSERVNRQTSELAIAISKAGETLFGVDNTISPIKIDNFLKGYFGSVATTLTMATDQVINPDRLDRPLNKYWMASVFMYDRDRKSADKDEAYAWNEKAGKRLATFRQLANRDPDAADAYLDKYEQDIVLGEALEQVFREAGEIRRYINDLNRNQMLIESMTKEEREAEIKAAQALEQELFSGLRELRNELRSQ